MAVKDLKTELKNAGYTDAEIIKYLAGVKAIYNTVKNFVRVLNMQGLGFKTACTLMNGYNEDGELFDTEQGEMVLTVHKRETGEGFYLSDYFAVFIKHVGLLDGYTLEDINKALL